MHKFEMIITQAACLPLEDIDTDQIIPARFLKTVDKTGLGRHLFHDWRYDAEGVPRPDFVLNKPETQGARLLIAGRNFGCGSSREHAVWALMDQGIAAVIAPSFADIFDKNSLRNGLLAIKVDPATLDTCLNAAGNGAQFTVDLRNNTVRTDSFSFQFEIDAFARDCLLEGVDDLGHILKNEDAIARFEAARN